MKERAAEHGAFLVGADGFDNDFFSLSVAEASMPRPEKKPLGARDEPNLLDFRL